MRAHELVEEAVELDPEFAAAWSRLSEARSLLYANSTPTPELAEGSREAAELNISSAAGP